MADEHTAVQVRKLSKDFKLPHLRKNTVKSIFTDLFSSSEINRNYEIQNALEDVSFEVKDGEFFGIVGRNGSGKSTLLKIVAGIYQPTKGSVHVSGKLVPFIELGVGFNSELTGRENVYLNGSLLGFSKQRVDKMYDDIVGFAELGRFMDQKLKNYSSGMQVRLAFSMAIRADADILLVDEVLAVGDAAFQRKCFEYFKELKTKKKTVIFVTHDMSAVREYCDRAMLIDKSRLQMIGKPEDIAREYALLFMNEAYRLDYEKKAGGKRWGTGDLKIQNVKSKITDDNLIVTVTARASKDIDKVVYGLHIIGVDAVEITAMNNRMIHAPDIAKVKAGDKVTFEWKMANIFNDGTYYVTLTLIDDVATPLDWYTYASTFRVMRDERSTTAVLPPVSVAHDISKRS